MEFTGEPRGSMYTTIRESGPKIPYYIGPGSAEVGVRGCQPHTFAAWSVVLQVHVAYRPEA